MRSLPRLPADTPMYDVLNLFQTGRSHMALLVASPAVAAAAAAAASVHRSNSNKIAARMYRGSPYRQEGGNSQQGGSSASHLLDGSAAKVYLEDREAEALEEQAYDMTDGIPVGIITIEDVIEELMQEEIVDETDQFIDNEQKIKVNTVLLSQSLPPRLRRVFWAGVTADFSVPSSSASSRANMARIASSASNLNLSRSQNLLNRQNSFTTGAAPSASETVLLIDHSKTRDSAAGG